MGKMRLVVHDKRPVRQDLRPVRRRAEIKLKDYDDYVEANRPPRRDRERRARARRRFRRHRA